MSVPAPGAVGSVGQCAFLSVVPLLVTGVPMEVVGSLFDDVIDVWVEMRSIHAAVVGSRHNMPQVSDDRIDHEELAMLVEIHAPWIRSA